MIEAIVSGLLLGLALVFSVGPVIFTVIKLRINYGILSAFYFIVGVWVSDILWVVTANFFSGFLGDLLIYKNWIGLLGGSFLFAIGIYFLFFKKYHTKEELDHGIVIKKSTHTGLFITGFLINTLNPGVIGLWLAATTKSISFTLEQKIITFSICLGLNIVADILKIRLTGKLGKKLTSKNITIINKISGLMYLAFGIALIAAVVYSFVKAN